MGKIIICDWNGTILNDVDANLKIINILLEKRGLEAIDLNKYRKLFKMPIVKFYKDLGFNFEKESFEKIAIDFIKAIAKSHQMLLIGDMDHDFDVASAIENFI